MWCRFHCAPIALALVLATAAFPASALRCGSRAISSGAHASEVLAACGEPSYRDDWLSYYPYLWNAGVPSGRESWYYNFGPSRLLYVLEFRSGRLQRERTEGYGFHPPAAPNCEPLQLVSGLSKYWLLTFCGEPAHRQGYATLRPQFAGDVVVGHVAVLREEWTYDFGSRRLQRFVILENGSITDVRTGRYGN